MTKKQIETVKNAFSDNNHSLILNEVSTSTSSSFLEEALYIYFSDRKKEKWSSSAFEQKLAKDYPDLLVKSIRICQVFLIENKIDFLIDLPLPSHLKIHQTIWKLLQSQEITLWQKIESSLNELSKFSLEDVLWYSVLWIENKRFLRSSIEHEDHLARVYNFFIQAYLSENSEKTLTNNEDCFKKKIIGSSITPLDKTLDLISNWLDFNDSFLSEYSFDLNTQLTLENGIIYLTNSPEFHYKYKLDGARYHLNRFNYFLKGAVIVDHLEEEGKLIIPKGRFKEDEDINRVLEIKKWRTLMFLDDLKIDSFKYGKQKIGVEQLLIPLLTYSTNRLARYEHTLEKYKPSSKNWTEAFSKVKMESFKKDVVIEPYFFEHKQEYLDFVASVLEELPIKIGEELVSLFSYEVRANSFNRFKKGYHVMKKPFLKFGDMLFCPIVFFANNDWFYPFAQAGIEHLNKKWNKQELKSTASKMEEDLAKLFKNQGFKVKYINDQEANKIDGDVDIIVEDERQTLFIQLKRTYFRLSLKDQYNERINTDNKAVLQLNKAEQFFTKNNEIYQAKHTPTKWIVTTSLENIGNYTEDIRKVNYFDVLEILKTYEIKTLQEMITFIEEDRILKNWLYRLNLDIPEELKYGILEAGFPILIDEPKSYRKALFVEDESCIAYTEMYNEALKLDKNGEKEMAIKMLHKCLSINSKDIDVLAAIANVYTDIQDFKNAFDSFEKALEIIPLEPFITRNYTIALFEGGKYYKALKLLIQLCLAYPFLAELRDYFEHNYTVCSMALSKIEQDELMTEWNKLN